MALTGTHKQRMTAHQVRYWVTFAEGHADPRHVVWSAALWIGDASAGLLDGDFMHSAKGKTVEQDVRDHLCHTIDRRVLELGKGPDPAWLASPVHLGPWR